MRTLDREEVAQHNLTVVATDHGSPRRSATQQLTVHVLDVNDEAPAFPRSHYEATVAENLPPGVPVLQLLATDRDLGKGLPPHSGASWSHSATAPLQPPPPHDAGNSQLPPSLSTPSPTPRRRPLMSCPRSQWLLCCRGRLASD